MDASTLQWMAASPENFQLWLLWGQTDEDRAAILEFHEESLAALRGELRAREVAETSTRDESAAPITQQPATVEVLFPTWEEPEAPLEFALKLAVARTHLEAA